MIAFAVLLWCPVVRRDQLSTQLGEKANIGVGAKQGNMHALEGENVDVMRKRLKVQVATPKQLWCECCSARAALCVDQQSTWGATYHP